MAIDVMEEHIEKTDSASAHQEDMIDPVEIDGAATALNSQPDPAMLEKISAIRTRLQVTFGQVVLALTAVPRYQHQSVGDLTHLVLEPLIRDRVAIATSKPMHEPAPQGPLPGIAMWASMSEEADAKIQDQIKASMFPVRLKPEDWTSGDRVWLLDVIATTKQLATAVLKNFRQVVKKDQIRMHPLVARMVDSDLVKTMGATFSRDENKSEVQSDVPQRSENTH